MSNRDHRSLVDSLAREFGGEVSFTGKSHLRLRIGDKVFFTASSPSDNRATKNFEKFVRRTLKK